MEGEELAGEDWARDEEMKLKAMKRRGVVRAPPPPLLVSLVQGYRVKREQ